MARHPYTAAQLELAKNHPNYKHYTKEDLHALLKNKWTATELVSYFPNKPELFCKALLEGLIPSAGTVVPPPIVPGLATPTASAMSAPPGASNPAVNNLLLAALAQNLSLGGRNDEVSSAISAEVVRQIAAQSAPGSPASSGASGADATVPKPTKPGKDALKYLLQINGHKAPSSKNISELSAEVKSLNKSRKITKADIGQVLTMMSPAVTWTDKDTVDVLINKVSGV